MNHETLQGSVGIEDTTGAEAKLQAKLDQAFGQGPMFHHTVRRHDTRGYDGQGMTYGGLHKNLNTAEKALEKVRDDIRRKEEKIETEETKIQAKIDAAEVIFLEVGEEYSPWAAPEHIHTHGEDDGTHGSKVTGQIYSSTLKKIEEH